jgi:lipid-binding SYLF domain-containing protein
MRKVLIGLALIVPVAFPAFAGPDRDNVDEHTKRIREAGVTLHEIMNAGDRSIPEDLLKRAQCVAVVPDLKRAGFILGAKYGKGVLTCRTANGWSAPATMRVEGGSIGLQIGAGETDLVLLVMNRSGEDKILRDKFTIGADASVMAGPVGRSANAATDAAMKAEILAYSRSHGVFGGVALEGATLRPDNDDNTKIYGRSVTAREIVHGDVPPPPAANGLYEELNRFPYRER